MGGYDGDMRLVKVLRRLRKEDWGSGKWLESLVRRAEGKNIYIFFPITQKQKALCKMIIHDDLI